MAKKSFRNSLFLLLVLMTTSCFSQREDFIFGQLIDSTKNETIPFASIRVKDKALGVITNIDGTFKIPLRFKALGDVLEISCMGYVTKEVLMEDLTEGQSNIIVLQPGGFQLSEAVVSAKIRGLTAKQIVKIAVNSIPQNYPSENFEIVGYYRDYQVKNGNYINLNEAIINVQDQGFTTKNILDNEYQLYSYTKNLDFEVDPFARQPYDYSGRNKIVPNARMRNDGGNEFITLRLHDAIRNYGLESFSFIDSLSTHFIENHQFRILRKTNFNKERVYEIDLTYEDKNYRAEGRIFINTDGFAIHKLDYALFKRRQPLFYRVAENAQERFTDGFKKMNGEMLYHIQIEYTKGARGQMFLAYISFYNKILLQRPAAFKSKFRLNLGDRTFRVRLNKMPVNPSKIKIGDFRILYRNKALPLKEFYFLEDELTFVVCPHLDYKRSKETFDYLFDPKERLQVPNLKFAPRNIKDRLGNKLDERKWEYIHQYREFFTQEAKLRAKQELDTVGLMQKVLPLDNVLQPINKEGLKNEYWKNTPLPNLEK
ncbi:carboxypeptidase-like regulatory domain-containing protein [Ulvibacterium marinum]|uniref:carboxypeptidase-like regulatory domain-containing protein n=1 Tax=Ulvibacterium marinum TaxID=2419782 RepID=UPI00249578A8|nr:carboxypeptidase-like regulatory domain-containing protein [Ulvibacterium marinum]